MIETRIDELLAERGRTFYWLAKETGISHTTLWRLKKGKALGINFGTLEGICLALGCQPGDVLKLASGVKRKKSEAGKSPTAKRGASPAPHATKIRRRPRG
jgi:putative transcriptional regulator